MAGKQSISIKVILGLLRVIFLRGKLKLSRTDEQALKRAEQEKKEPCIFHKGLLAKYKFMCDNQVLLQHLGRLAYKGLTDQKKGLSLHRRRKVSNIGGGGGGGGGGGARGGQIPSRHMTS